MRLDSTRRRKVLINVTSLIDVVFLLLLFFVVTSTFLEQPGLDLQLPEAGSVRTGLPEEVTIQLTADGGLSLDGAPVTPEGLPAALQAAWAGSDGRSVVLEADARVPHGRVVAVMDAARRAGAGGLVVATRPGDDPAPEP